MYNAFRNVGVTLPQSISLNTYLWRRQDKNAFFMNLNSSERAQKANSFFAVERRRINRYTFSHLQPGKRAPFECLENLNVQRVIFFGGELGKLCYGRKLISYSVGGEKCVPLFFKIS